MACSLDLNRGAAGSGREDEGEGEMELEGEEKTEFRGCCALLNYLGLDRSDIQFATNQVCREMARPTKKRIINGRKCRKNAIKW